MGFEIKFGGHRGMGCTDSPFAIERNVGQKLPLENTESSIAMALRRADYVETDMIRTRDEHIVLTHSNDYSQHVAPQFRPTSASFISSMTLAEVLNLQLGQEGAERITTMQRSLQLARPIALANPTEIIKNYEEKDVQGTPCERVRFPNLSQLALREIQKADFPLTAIRFSSFSLDSIAEMAIASREKARLGMLFDLAQDKGGDVGKPMFASGGEDYLGFTPSTVKDVLKRIPSLEAVHPEIQSLTDKTVELAAKNHLKIATWGWLEQNPLTNQTTAEITLNALQLCKRYNVRLEIITDFVEPMRKFVNHKGYGAYASQPRGLV